MKRSAISNYSTKTARKHTGAYIKRSPVTTAKIVSVVFIVTGLSLVAYGLIQAGLQ